MLTVRMFKLAMAAIGLVLGFSIAASAQTLTKWRHALVSAKGDAGIFFMEIEKDRKSVV